MATNNATITYNVERRDPAWIRAEAVKAASMAMSGHFTNEAWARRVHAMAHWIETGTVECPGESCAYVIGE